MGVVDYTQSTLTTSDEGGCKSELDKIKNNKVYSVKT